MNVIWKWWERKCARWGQQAARRILDNGGVDYSVWCDACNLPVLTDSTPGPATPLQPGELNECVLDHPEHHRIVYPGDE